MEKPISAGDIYKVYAENVGPCKVKKINAELKNNIYNYHTNTINSSDNKKDENVTRKSFNQIKEDDNIQITRSPIYDIDTKNLLTGRSKNIDSLDLLTDTHIQDNIFRVKKYMSLQTENLSESQKEILTMYTGNLAAQINMHIKLGTADIKFSKEMDLLDDALEKGIIPEPIVLHRVTSMSFLNIGADKDTLKKILRRLLAKLSETLSIHPQALMILNYLAEIQK